MTEAPLLVRHDALQAFTIAVLEAFKADMDDLLRSLKDSPKAEGADRIWVAGEPEWECEQRRRRDGIPLAPGLVRQLREAAAAVGVPFSLAS